MFNPANEAHFTLDLPGIEHDFKVLSFHGSEAISQCYRIQLELISEQPDLDLEALLQHNAWLDLGNGTGLHGLIHHAAIGESGKRMTRYRLELVPHLHYLGLRHNQRIFQHLTVPQIIAQILEDHGIHSDAFLFQLGSDYPERDYCTQYGETDLHFLQRLCEEEGIHYHFRHSEDAHLLVFGDDQTCFPRLAPTGFDQGNGLVADEPVVKRFGVRLETRTSRVTRRDYNHEKARLQLESNARSEQLPDLEDYNYPGQFSDRSRGKHLARRTLERHRSDYQLATAQSDQPTLRSGHFLELQGHTQDNWNDLWLITELHHQGKQPQVLEESITDAGIAGAHASTPSPLAGEGWGEGDGFTQGYRNHFTATPWDTHYRPALDHPKPKALGNQTAVVTGPENEEIHCDAQGRIKVQFHWDREGQADAHTSCWLRVASNWAGNHWGSITIPRIGMEVLVSFLEGDPDQPLVSGCLYNSAHPVPYELPEHKTRTVFKSMSSPGGDGFNELRIEDRAGEEQIFIHAQRDWDQNIQHDQKIRVGNERHERIEANRYTENLAEEHHTTHADRKSELKADDHLTVANNQHIKLGQGQLIETGREIHYYAGDKVVIDAGMELTAKGGGSFLKLDPSGVTLSGPNIRINAGGAAGRGSGLGILLPEPVDPATFGQYGNPLDKALANAPLDTLETEPHTYRFNMQLRDVPGDDGFPLAFTPWLIRQGEAEPLLEGVTDEQGRISLSAEQEELLSQAAHAAAGNLSLSYPGQRIALSLHQEQEDRDMNQLAIAALGYQQGATSPQISGLLHERCKQDSHCDSDIYAHLQTQE